MVNIRKGGKFISNRGQFLMAPPKLRLTPRTTFMTSVEYKKLIETRHKERGLSDTQKRRLKKYSK